MKIFRNTVVLLVLSVMGLSGPAHVWAWGECSCPAPAPNLTAQGAGWWRSYSANPSSPAARRLTPPRGAAPGFSDATRKVRGQY
jgi:hypothetical protein